MSTSSPASADLPVPPKEQLRAIAKAQDEKHHALRAKGDHGEEEVAAKLIQRNYRGYRERRQLEGLRLDASTRWIEVRHVFLFSDMVD
ncbi:uncharacterized protein BKA78DRAFT_326942 [Phyllosticta capitalensis]|uniref:uncharacterized protein n=1 Tax=Phyllosticta capitalensis TaxID=121624 RepID=UPI0031306D61